MLWSRIFTPITSVVWLNFRRLRFIITKNPSALFNRSRRWHNAGPLFFRNSFRLG